MTSFSSRVKSELKRPTPARSCCDTARAAIVAALTGSEDDGYAAPSVASAGSAPEYAAPIESASPEYTAPAAPAASVASTYRRCCRRAALRAAFLTSGTIADPLKQYHLEISCRNRQTADILQNLMESFAIAAKISERAGGYSVYLKESDSISTFLGASGANVAMMEYENARIVKEMRNNLNRAVNCETANIDKSAEASARQIFDILLIKKVVGLGKLPPLLRDIAEARLKNKEIGLAELGATLSPPIGKSGANHRMRKLGAFADKLRRDRNADNSDPHL